jgi:hypothetical protein
MKLRAIILKKDLPLGPNGQLICKGARIKVPAAAYDLYVPRLAYDADEYLAAAKKQSKPRKAKPAAAPKAEDK